MITIHDKSKCTGCTACAVSCPVHCIRMVKDHEGFLYPRVEEQLCIRCGRCEKKCPLIAKEDSRDYAQTQAYAAYSKDDDLRAQSSSGGIFSELAIWVIQQGGVVIGAGFDKDFSVSHMCVEREEDLSVLRGSKYVQSAMGQNYVAAKSYLDHGQWVLFSGTPCQIAGLYRFLGADHERLITQDIVCHGVPSPGLWEQYLVYRNRLHGCDVIDRIRFRDKSTGWRQYSLTITYDGAAQYSTIASKDSMMKAFLKNVCLRPSCYTCVFKQLVKQSDITLADFWGVENILPDWDDDKGISLVMLNSPKGKSLFSNIQSRIKVCAVDREAAIAYNLSAVKSASKPRERESFMSCVAEKGFHFAAKNYLESSFLSKVKYKFRSLFKR